MSAARITAPPINQYLRDTAASPYARASLAKARGRVMLRSAIVAGILAFATASAHAQQLAPLPPQPVGLAWPTAEWAEAPLPDNMDRPAFDLAITEAFAGANEGYGETRAVLIVQHGRIVFERYEDGYNRDMRLVSWSMAK